MNRTELLDQLSQDILTYTMKGGFPEREVARTIKPRGLDERFNEYELLLDLHFILQNDVVAFIRRLPKRLRQIRTETEAVSRTTRGAVDGHINWPETTKQRCSQNPRDRSLFVTDHRSEDYDIPQNIVLKRLLSIVYSTLGAAEEYLCAEYEWVKQTWKGTEQLIDNLSRIVERNVYLRRIRDPHTYEPTERMLTTAANARQDVYRNAAALLRRRERLFNGDQAAIRQLLDETAITPDDEHRLFELFVLFRFVGTLEQLQDASPKFETISSGRQEVARFDGDKQFILYHDQSADDREISFGLSASDDPDNSRTEQVQAVTRRIADQYFKSRSFQSVTDRPDVIVLEIIDETHNQYDYLIAEVKNSREPQTIKQGIRETLEYLAFLQVNEEFVFTKATHDSYFGSESNGVLVVQDMEQETASLESQAGNEIKILQAAELETQLQTILETLV